MACAVDLKLVRDGVEAISGAAFRTATRVINSFLPLSPGSSTVARALSLRFFSTLTFMTGKRLEPAPRNVRLEIQLPFTEE
jgi:hypothetical protein